MNEWMWWTVTLALPCLAIVAYWWIARRQVRSATADLNAALERERQVVAHVSHRIRDPLTVIYGFSEALVDASDMHDPDDVAAIAATVNAEALDVMRAVEDLVTAREFDRGNLEIRSIRFDPLDVIERVVTPFKRLGFPISVEAWSGTAMSDPLRFRQVLQALVSNAVRHGGSEITILADLEGDMYRCTVADDGPGIPIASVDRLFGESHRPSAETAPDESPPSGDEEQLHALPHPPVAIDTARSDGLGLGLAVSVRLSELLGGELTYKRAPSLTAVTVSLPTAGWPGPLNPLAPKPSDFEEQEYDRDARRRDLPARPPAWPTVSFEVEDSGIAAKSDDPSAGEAGVAPSDEGAVPL